MTRRLIAAAWIFGAIAPLLMGALYLVGCCVLPFHGVMHNVVPLCHMATNGAADHDDAQTPAREPVRRIAGTLPYAKRVALVSVSTRLVAPRAAAYRSFIAYGALRCDQDVGLHVLVDTFRI